VSDPWTEDDPPGTRSIRKEVELPVAPEAVWEAVATGPGIACWFCPTELEPRVGGRISQSFGEGVIEAGEVTAYEPGRRLVIRSSEQPDGGGPAQAFEYLVEARDGGSTVLRFLHSGFSTDARFDDEYGVVDNGWNLLFGILRTYLVHFAGQQGTSAQAMASHGGPTDEAWDRLVEAAQPGVEPDGITVGAPVTLAPSGFEAMAGVIDAWNRGVVGNGFSGTVLGLRLPTVSSGWPWRVAPRDRRRCGRRATATGRASPPPNAPAPRCRPGWRASSRARPRDGVTPHRVRQR